MFYRVLPFKTSFSYVTSFSHNHFFDFRGGRLQELQLSFIYGNTYTIVHVRLSGVEYYSVCNHARNFESAKCVNVVWDWFESMSRTLCDICWVIVINNEESPAEIIINFPDVTKTEPNNPVLASSVLREINKSLSQTFSANRQVKNKSSTLIFRIHCKRVGKMYNYIKLLLYLLLKLNFCCLSVL